MGVPLLTQIPGEYACVVASSVPFALSGDDQVIPGADVLVCAKGAAAAERRDVVIARRNPKLVALDLVGKRRGDVIKQPRPDGYVVA